MGSEMCIRDSKDGSVAAAYREAAAAVMTTLSGSEEPRGPTISMTE